MTISYTKDQRAYAKANNMHLCTVAARGIERQGPCGEIASRLVEDCALHTMLMKEDFPFERVKEIDLPHDIAEQFEQFKVAIIRHRSDDFRQIKPHEILLLLNTLRHFTLT